MYKNKEMVGATSRKEKKEKKNEKATPELARYSEKKKKKSNMP